MSYRNLKAAIKAKKAIAEHYKELFSAAIGELKFERMRNDHLHSVINEVEVLLDKGIPKQIIKQVILNSLERESIDKSIHNHLILNNDDRSRN